MRYTARAPLRIDFGGGWTDVAAYASASGGAVLNAAITRFVQGYIARPEGEGMLHALRGDRGYVQYSLDLPSGAGLGAAAAQIVLWVTLVRSTIANTADRREVAEIACRIAPLLGIVGGKQDEYASALGGITYYTFGERVEAHRLELSPTFREELRSRLVLVYSGPSRLSPAAHEQIWSGYREGEATVVRALDSLKRLAGDMRRALLSQDLDGLAELVAENWEHQKSLHDSITNADVNAIFDLARRHGAQGGKACGAGGGGCLLFVASRDRSDELRQAMAGRRLRVIDFDFDTYGVFLKKA